MHSCPPFLYKRGVPIEIFFTKKNRLIYSYKQLNHCYFNYRKDVCSMAKGCDSSWDFDYKSRVDALVDEGYTFIGRYLNHSAGVRNGLTVSEANRLSSGRIHLCSL